MLTKARTGVYHSKVLGERVGLRRLWIAFSGWWPERGASLESATFKELEAVAVLGRLAPDERRTMVVASAGNTAAAFAQIATEHELAVLIVIPLDAWAGLAAQVRMGPTVRVVAVENGTYDDAIVIAKQLAARDGYVFEGGVRNVGRRDGMGTALLAGVEAIGALPDAYVQAVGSAAGALAAHEAALRLLDDGRFGTRLPRLLLAQNAPFTPIHDAWSRRSAVLDERSPLVAREQLARIGAAALSNQAPPYATVGGVREALAQSDGRTYAIGNDELTAAMLKFAELEGRRRAGRRRRARGAGPRGAVRRRRPRRHRPASRHRGRTRPARAGACGAAAGGDRPARRACSRKDRRPLRLIARPCGGCRWVRILREDPHRA